MAVDEAAITALIAATTAANLRFMRLSDAGARYAAAREADAAMSALNAADHLDPTREARAWYLGGPRERLLLAPERIPFYMGYIARFGDPVPY